MSAPSPTLLCPTMEHRCAATRALYDLGFRRLGRPEVDKGVELVSPNPKRSFIYIEGRDIGFYTAEEAAYDVHAKRLTVVNSIAHLIAYIKRMGLAPKVKQPS